MHRHLARGSTLQYLYGENISTVLLTVRVLLMQHSLDGTEEKKRGWHVRGVNAEARKLETVEMILYIASTIVKLGCHTLLSRCVSRECYQLSLVNSLRMPIHGETGC